jgi:caspase domain-containing protein
VRAPLASSLFFLQPAYALIIGVSEYQHSQPADDKSLLEPQNFRALKFAAKDAADFATFLELNGFLPDNVSLLCDKEATTKNIKIAFRKLSDTCRATGPEKPLVIVYFSGHGSADEKDDHYLVPYEGERNCLYATAISNEEFNSLLGDINTDRMVVFLDACHSGALAGAESKDARGQPLKYDSLRGLGGGSGRFVVTSCRRDQESYESDGNGIFTGKLLELLGGASAHFAELEEIGVLPLYERLREEVDQAAYEKHKKRQEPQINATDATGIVLAINQDIRSGRLARDEAARQRREVFFNEVIAQLKNMSTRGRPAATIAWKLERYVCKQISDEGHEPLYIAFNENLEMWFPGDHFIVVQCCEIMFDKNNEVNEAIRRRNVESSKKPVDKLELAPPPSLGTAPNSSAPLAPLPSVPDKQTLRRMPESALRTVQMEKK